TSRCAWSTALRTSWRSTSETTSKVGTGRRYLAVHGSVPERPKGADCKSAGTAFGGSNPPRPTSLLRQKPLQLHHVEPSAELPAHLALGADELETAAAMQRDRSLVTSDDAGDDGVEAVLAGQLDERLEQQA